MSRHHAQMAVTVLLGLLAAPATADTQRANPPSGWHLLRTANPSGGPDAVSISHTPDLTQSDLDLAGLMLRCSVKGVEVLIVLVTPFSPRAQPDVTISTRDKEWRFSAHVVSPGMQLLLPEDAMRLAAGPLRSAREVVVKVTSQEHSFGGVIPIEGIAEALAALTANCPAG